MSGIWVPKTEWERNVTAIEPSPERSRQLPDGRLMAESRLTISKEWLRQMFEGYRCAACLEDVAHLGAFPKVCPLCGFKIRELQYRQLHQDLVEERPTEPASSWLSRERERLLRETHEPKVQMVVPKSKIRKRKP
jgi:PAS domain-containing protein